jgi:elongation factor Ts
MGIVDKKSSRNTKERMIYLYVHNGNELWILVKINCETDFITKWPEFPKLAKNIAIQIVSNFNIKIGLLLNVSKTINDEIT